MKITPPSGRHTLDNAKSCRLRTLRECAAQFRRPSARASRRPFVRSMGIVFGGMLVALGLSVRVWAQTVNPEPRPATLDPNGTLHVPAFSLPTSELISPEFRDAYKRTVESLFPTPPSNDAPPEEWEKYSAEENRRAEPRLIRDLSHNPVEITETRIAGVPIAVITPRDGVAGDNRHRVLVYLHGGGFFMNRDLKSAMIGAIPIASIGRIKVIAVAYRQFPAFRYPAASEDVAKVYGALVEQYKPASIGLYGCSAGGVLVGQSVAWFQIHHLPRPGAVAMLCSAPMIPGSAAYAWGAGDSRLWGAQGNFLGPWPAGDAAAGYFEGASVDSAEAYPGISDKVLAKFPPILLVSGTRAVEMSDVVVAHAKFLRLGVKSSLYILEGGWHSAPLGAQGTPEGDAVMTYMTRWFREHLAR
jgi:monoterpene epsilon-lactone hydrolase